MSRTLKIALVCICIAVGLPAAALASAWLALILHSSGSWPFAPLERIENTISLPNGGLVIIEAIEQRGLRSDGWTVYASYKPSAGKNSEKIGVWEGHDHQPEVYITGDLVVLPSPDQTTLYARDNRGNWKFFSLRFPMAASSLPISHYTTLTTLTATELARIREDMDEDEMGWSPSVSIGSFDPRTRELHVLYRTNPATVRHLRLQLSEDGTDLSLIESRKEKRINE